MGDMIGWYSIDMKGDTIDHPPVALPEALAIAKKYYANAGKKYQTAEESTMETFFGYARSKEVFLELVVFRDDQVSCHFETADAVAPEAPWYKKIFASNVFSRDIDLHSWTEMEIKITEFFETDPAELRGRMEQA